VFRRQQAQTAQYALRYCISRISPGTPMIVTEEILRPYRSKGGLVNIVHGSFPDIFFTQTSDAFRFHSENPTTPENLRNPKETLEIVLVLAFTRNVPVLKPGREWLALVHQAGGYSCETQGMIATRLTPRASVLSSLQLIAREGYGAENGYFNRSSLLSSRILSYVAALKRIGVDCECTWSYLTESLYPIDATQSNLDQVAEGAPGMETISDWKGHSRARYCPDPAIFFMTDNSD
jgi:hypothetical protein